MNAAHFHLVLNHFPLIGLVFSLLLLAFGFFRKNETLIKTGFLVILVSGVIAIPTYLTGEPAEKIIEKTPGFSEILVEAHEEAAEIAIWFLGATTLAAAVGIWISLKQLTTPKPVLAVILALNLVSLAAIGRTSFWGGKISHPEIRENALQSTISQSYNRPK